MAAGEYVSVSSQSDAERGDLAREAAELKNTPVQETEELAQIYVARGLESRLARQVAGQLMAKDALGAHARDELGITATTIARPATVSWSCAGAKTAMAMAAKDSIAILGMIGAKAGGADIVKPTIRVTFWGALAMALTSGIGLLFAKFI